MSKNKTNKQLKFNKIAQNDLQLRFECPFVDCAEIFKLTVEKMQISGGAYCPKCGTEGVLVSFAIGRIV